VIRTLRRCANPGCLPGGNRREWTYVAGYSLDPKICYLCLKKLKRLRELEKKWKPVDETAPKKKRNVIEEEDE